MTQDNEQKKETDFLFPPWLKTSMEMWFNLAQIQPATDDNGQKYQSAINNRFVEQWQKNLKSMKTFSQTMSEPESAAAALNAINTLPEIILKLAKSGWDASFQTQQHILEKAGKIGKRAEAYNFDNLDQEVFKALTEIYEKELRQYFHIPQLGLTRFYQERFNELLDKKNMFETTLAEFFSIIFLPIEKSFKVLQEKLQTMAQEGALPKEAKESYGMWVKILEGHYMSLFKSKEYSDALHNTIDKMEDFILAKNNCMQDFLQFFPVPTTKEMDELYKEFHLLKKRVKELEKKVKSV
ncbi:MAG: poly(R)-hydroxyalkanoic acid synthase subunit PhaE [Smithellaceae bacterium]